MTKAEKEAFKKRMAAGRRKAAKARGEKNPKRKAKKKTAAKRKPAAKKKPAGSKRRPTKNAIRKAQRNAQHKRGKKNPKGRRRNQEGSIEEAERQFESFHGKPPGRIREYTEQYRYPEHFAELGKLIELRFMLDDGSEGQLRGFGSTQVVSTPDGSNIYFIGGDQSIDIGAFDLSSDKDFVELGPCTYISYHTIKGFHDFEPTTYWHQFGEEDDIYPGLVYDRLNKRLFLTSGNYRIRPEGIVN
jgi:hypothetical protein